MKVANLTAAVIDVLTAAVIDVFKTETTNHNANQFFSTIAGRKNDLDPQAQMFARRVLQIRRAACKKQHTTESFKQILRTYATKHRRNGKLPKSYRHEDQEDETQAEVHPDEQPHPSTSEHDENWDEDICFVEPMGLLIESVVME